MPVEPPPRTTRGWWMDEALANDPGEPCPPLAADTAADVVILGGGYTGMWTAYFLKERDPGVDVVLLEQDICGGGPSGRNGGFVNGYWSSIGELAQRFGDGDALELCLAASRSVAEIGRFCQRTVSTPGSPTPASWPRRRTRSRKARGSASSRKRGASARRTSSSSSPPTRSASESTRQSCLVASSIPTLPPCSPHDLARGLRRVLLERGVRIFEGTPVRRFAAGPPSIAETPGGSVRAAEAVIGVGSWGIHWKRFRRNLAVRGSYIVLTEPSPERLEEINWTDGEALRDLRPSLHYVRTTPDGRIAMGCAGMQPGLARKIGPRFTYDERFLRKAAADLHRMFPSFRDVPIAAGWGGPIDVAGMYLPFFGSSRSGNVHHGLGFTGNGVAPCHLGGRILASLAMHAEDGFSRLALVTHEPLRFPPEPILSPGMLVVNEAIRRKDDAEDRGRRPNPLVTFVSRMPRRLGYNLGPR